MKKISYFNLYENRKMCVILFYANIFMHRKFVENLIFLLTLNIIVKPLWIFGIDLTVQNVVGEQVYGLYFALFNFTIIFNCILDFGINNFNSRSIAQSENFLQESFSKIFTLKLLLGVVYFVVVMLSSLIWRYKGYALWLLLLLTFNQFLSCFILYLRSNLSGLLLFKTDSFLSVIDRVIMITICGILLWGNVVNEPFRIEWFVYSQTTAYIITILIALPIVLSHTKLHSPFVDIACFKQILKQSIPFALLALMTNLHNRIDAVFLERLLPEGIGSAQAGVYASAFRLLDAATMIAYLFSVILLPLFSNMLAKNENVKTIFKTAFSLIFVYGFLLAMTAFNYNAELMSWLYNGHVEESSRVFGWLMLSIVPLSATYVFGSLLTAKGEMKKLNMIAFTAVILNILLNLLLIFRFQAIGSAVASLCTQCFIIIAEAVMVIKIFGFSVSRRTVVKISVFAAISALVIFISHNWRFHWMWNLCISLILSVIAACLMGMINIKQTIQYYVSKKNDVN